MPARPGRGARIGRHGRVTQAGHRPICRGTTLAAVTADRSVTRRAVITLFRHQPALVGLPTENPVPDESRPGDHRLRRPGRRPGAGRGRRRLGTPRESLLAEGPAGRSPVSRPGAPAAARGRGDLPGALARPGRRGASPRAAPDAGMVGRRTAADIRHRRGADRPAGRSRPAHPRRGGAVRLRRQRTGITFVEAGSHQPIAAGVRHLDFSGDLIDQAVLAHVVAELSAGGAVDTTSTSAIGSLTHLRAECRAAKERLSSGQRHLAARTVAWLPRRRPAHPHRTR